MFLFPSSATSFRGPFVAQARVIKALILRDIRTRFFGHGLGYLIAIAWPLAHIVVLIGIWSFMGRATPYGSSLALWFATGLVPVMSFIYASRWIMLSVVVNKSLMAFPAVKLVDILVARAILESGAACCMALALFGLFFAFGIDPFPASAVDAMKAVGAGILLGIGFGFINGVIAAIYQLWVTVYTLATIVLYILSGVLFVPDHMPEAAREALSWNPLVHAVEWMRLAYYGAYSSRTFDPIYLISWGLVTIFIALLVARFGRRFVSNA
ncbi:ABC transporter permease [Enterovirga aerilata]|uniref:ABC transporter permease n=1 Tax=Enterovirga aerilata TaxID=2730920 RepID=A0A849IDN6_9HYPH|nr:ABC transporter permease [Enterovirga sp. DB1703]NNM74549.1 ABC transporter permease [Enterovirga sp. DB1703]